MFCIYKKSNVNINKGDILTYRDIQVIVLEVSAPMFFSVNGDESYKCLVRKV
jgi:hypothetical protein